ncbi:MAG: hypothetical protein CMI56_00785 [Parcubacteria group bacterium]|nr:hypothetical protein [Parcubacteria group bacterium]
MSRLVFMQLQPVSGAEVYGDIQIRPFAKIIKIHTQSVIPLTNLNLTITIHFGLYIKPKLTRK